MFSLSRNVIYVNVSGSFKILLYFCSQKGNKMDKNTFKQEISDYTACGGKFAFAFGDIHLPVLCCAQHNQSYITRR